MSKNFSYLVLFIFLVTGPVLKAQDYTWWNEKHQWDGKTPWEQYITLSAKHLGPNALRPLPSLPAVWEEGGQLFTSLGAYYQRRTQSAYFQVDYQQVIAGKVLVQAWLIPLQTAWMDSLYRDANYYRIRDGHVWAIGDLHFRFSVVLKQSNKGRLSLSSYLKTASGGGLEAGQFTDTPGYQINLDYHHQKSQKFWYSVGMGFMAYQTYSLIHRQDDAFAYCTRLGFKLGRNTIEGGIFGYAGYLNNGDRPCLLSLDYSHGRFDRLQLGINAGLHDYPHYGLSIRMRLWKSAS